MDIEEIECIRVEEVADLVRKHFGPRCDMSYTSQLCFRFLHQEFPQFHVRSLNGVLFDRAKIESYILTHLKN